MTIARRSIVQAITERPIQPRFRALPSRTFRTSQSARRIRKIHGATRYMDKAMTPTTSKKTKKAQTGNTAPLECTPLGSEPRDSIAAITNSWIRPMNAPTSPANTRRIFLQPIVVRATVCGSNRLISLCIVTVSPKSGPAARECKTTPSGHSDRPLCRRRWSSSRGR